MKCWPSSYVPRAPSPELVAIGRISGDLLEPEVFVQAGSVKDHVALAHTKLRSDLRHTDDVHLEIAEHFVGPSSNGMTAHTSCN